MAVIYGTASPNFIQGTPENDLISGWAKNGNLNSPSGNDTLLGNAGNDTLYGGTGNDSLIGSLGRDNLYGGLESDFLEGNDGNDKLYGGVGSDSLSGSNGNDTLTGGFSNNDIDTLTGGSGADKFNLWENTYYSAFMYEPSISVNENSLNDYALITDFNPNEDVIVLNSRAFYDLKDAPFNVGTSAPDTALYLIGFSGLNDELVGIIQDSSLSLSDSNYFKRE